MKPVAGRNSWIRWGVIAAFLALLVAALMLDHSISSAAEHHWRAVKHHSRLAAAVKELGAYRVMLGVVVILCVLHPQHWKAGALVLASACMGGMFEVLLKWVVGRSRPVHADKVLIKPFSFDPCRGGVAGFFDQANLCFPSGHATLAFAVATSLNFLLPRWAVLWFCLALCVGAERVAELAHYPSDVVGGAISGTCAAVLTRKLFERWSAPASRGLEVISVQPANAPLLVPKTMAGDEGDPR